MKKFALAFAALSLLSMPVTVNAAPCKDAKGRFMKCPTKAFSHVKKAPCRDAKGKFAKCHK